MKLGTGDGNGRKRGSEFLKEKVRMLLSTPLGQMDGGTSKGRENSGTPVGFRIHKPYELTHRSSVCTVDELLKEPSLKSNTK